MKTNSMEVGKLSLRASDDKCLRLVLLLLDFPLVMSNNSFIEAFHQLLFPVSKATDFFAPRSEPCRLSLDDITLSTSWLVNPATLWLLERSLPPPEVAPPPPPDLVEAVWSSEIFFCFRQRLLKLLAIGHSKAGLGVSVFSTAFLRLILIHLEQTRASALTLNQLTKS